MAPVRWHIKKMTRVFKMHKAGAARRAPVPVRARPPRPIARAALARGAGNADAGSAEAARPEEFGGPAGPEPTRYGDWERKGICYDF